MRRVLRKMNKLRNYIFLILILSFFQIGCHVFYLDEIRGKKYKEDVNLMKGKINLGMSEEEVIEAWGKPIKIKVIKNQEYDEIWLYKPHWKFKNLLFFKEGTLIGGNPDPERLIY